VAAVSAPSGRSLLGRVAGVASARARVKGRSSRLAAFIGENVLTVAAMAAADTGLWHLGPVAGWLSVGVSLLIIDFKLQA
jgi:hypothetical protein